MNCDAVADKIADFTTGRLATEVASEVKNHVAGCPACARFQGAVQRLYALEDECMPPAVRPLPDVLITRRRSRFVRRAAAACILLAVIGVATFKFETSPPRPANTGAVIELPRFEATLPRFPVAYPAGGWIEDAALAAELSVFTGKPLLTRYSFTPCPRCRTMEKELASDEANALLTDFICLKVPFDSEVPAVLSGRDPPSDARFLMPAVEITLDGNISPIVYELKSLDEVRSVVEVWRRGQAQPLHPLSVAAFEHCVDVLRAHPGLVAEGRLGDALTALDGILRLREDGYDTRFVEVASSLKAALMIQIDAFRARLEAAANDAATKAAARDGARAFLALLGTHAAAAPFRLLAR